MVGDFSHLLNLFNQWIVQDNTTRPYCHSQMVWFRALFIDVLQGCVHISTHHQCFFKPDCVIFLDND